MMLHMMLYARQAQGTAGIHPDCASAWRMQGDMRPGLWHAALSRMGLLLRSCFDKAPAAAGGGPGREPTICGRPAPAVPPVFASCTQASHATPCAPARAQAYPYSCSAAPVACRLTPNVHPHHWSAPLQLVSEANQLTARDAYWAAVTTKTQPAQQDEALELLHRAVAHNAHVAEPHVLIAQIHMHRCGGGMEFQEGDGGGP